METEKQRKITVEIVVDCDKDFDIDKAIALAWGEFKKCEGLSAVERGNRTVFGLY